MAKPVTYSGTVVAIFLKAPGGTGDFSRPCGLTSHTVTFTKNMQEVQVPDCDDPDLPSWIERGVESLDFGANGSGVLAAEALPVFWDAFNSTESIEARIYVGKPDNITTGYYWDGNVHVNQFEVSGEKGNKAQTTIGIVSDGEMTFTKISTGP